MRLDIDRVSKTFRGKVRALDCVGLTIPTGILGLLGANGAGKTTLMRLLIGLIRPDSGKLTIGDHDMSSADGRLAVQLAVQRVLGYLPQDLGMYPDLTARAEGRVWSLVTNGSVPSAGTVLSPLPCGDATRYRIVAAERPSADAEPVAPTLEDGYVALAQQHSLAATAEPAA